MNSLPLDETGKVPENSREKLDKILISRKYWSDMYRGRVFTVFPPFAGLHMYMDAPMYRGPPETRDKEVLVCLHFPMASEIVIGTKISVTTGD